MAEYNGIVINWLGEGTYALCPTNAPGSSWDKTKWVWMRVYSKDEIELHIKAGHELKWVSRDQLTDGGSIL